MFLNRTLADWLERPRKTILGRTMREVIGEKAYEYRRPLVEAALQGEKQWFIADFEHPTRGTLTVQTQYVPHQGPGGEVVGLILVIQDVTEQRAAELAIRESEARFRRIANSAPVMMWVTRLDRSRDFVNDAYAEFAGLSREEARVLDWRTRIHPDDGERLVAESVAGEASLKPFTLEARYLRHDGEWRCVPCQSRASTRRASCRASSAWRPTSPSSGRSNRRCAKARPVSGRLPILRRCRCG
jgi:PAS domain S-box-containing protein